MPRPLAMQAGTCAVPTRRLMQLPFCATSKQGSNLIKSIVLSIVADPDPDPSDPHVFGPPGSEVCIWILLSPSKNSKKNLDSCCFVTSF